MEYRFFSKVAGMCIPAVTNERWGMEMHGYAFRVVETHGSVFRDVWMQILCVLCTLTTGQEGL